MAQGDDDYRVPTIVKLAYKWPLTRGQISHRYPWAVIVIRKGRRMRKLCHNIGHAVVVHRQLKAKGYMAYIVSRSRGYDIPPAYRERIPQGYFWCPRCAAPRRLERMYQENGKPVTFSGRKKEWNTKKEYFEFKERQLHQLRCPICYTTNRDPIFRRNNQPWEFRRIKRGARRIKRRHKTQRTPHGFRVEARKKKR